MADLGVSRHELVEGNSGKSRKLTQYIAALTATLGALASGTMLGWSSPVIYKITQENSTDYDFPVSATEGAWISSVTNLGAAMTCIPTGFIMDTFGRKRTMLFLTIPFVVGWLLITFGANVGMLIAGRFLTGVAGGAMSITAPAYNSEIAEDSIRGTLGSFFQLMITSGILFSYAVGGYTPVFVFNMLCTCIPIIFAVIFFFMPESPNFLVIKNRNDEARKALVFLRGRNYDVDQELNKLKMRTEESNNTAGSFRSAITKKTAVKAIIICYMLMFFLQFSGINAVLFNTMTIFESAGALVSATMSGIIIGVIQVLASGASTIVVDRLGRRILLMTSALVMSVCSTALGVYFFLLEIHGKESEMMTSISWLPLTSLSLFITAFCLGFGGIPWMMAAELCPIEIKGFVGSTAGTLNWLLSFVVTSTFNSLNNAIGSGQVLWLFGGIMLIAFLFIFFVVPETKGKSIDEILILLGGKPKAISIELQKTTINTKI